MAVDRGKMGWKDQEADIVEVEMSAAPVAAGLWNIQNSWAAKMADEIAEAVETLEAVETAEAAHTVVLDTVELELASRRG